MPDDKNLADINSRAAEVREIAAGIFDNAEREIVLRFVFDAVKMAAEKAEASKRHRT